MGGMGLQERSKNGDCKYATASIATTKFILKLYILIFIPAGIILIYNLTPRESRSMWNSQSIRLKIVLRILEPLTWMLLFGLAIEFCWLQLRNQTQYFFTSTIRYILWLHLPQLS